MVAQARHPGSLVLAGDTVVAIGDDTLEKPKDEEDAVRMLRMLAGREHDVFTGLALATPDGRLVTRADRARVRFRDLGEDDVRAYVATGEPMDKAGGYGIQSRGAALVASVEGDYFTVMGLSVFGLVSLLASCGFDYRFGPLVPRGMSGSGATGTGEGGRS